MRKRMLWAALLSMGGVLVCMGLYSWTKSRNAVRKNRRKARSACEGYRKLFKRRCKVVRGLTCGKGWQHIAAFRYPSYLACRRAIRNASIKKARNALHALNPLVNAYKLYMAHISKGRKTRRLPLKLREIYQPYFRVPLTRITVGTSRQLEKSALTDCYRMFFRPEMKMMRQIRKGIFSDRDNEGFFLHELAHAEQCFRVGGRNNYAWMWFRHLRKSVIRNILQGKALNSDNIHKLQPMEKNAERKAIWVLEQTGNHWKR